jgi:hypothetical protein
MKKLTAIVRTEAHYTEMDWSDAVGISSVVEVI